MEEFEKSASHGKTKTIYVSTVISIALVLLMTGLLGLILVHAKNLSIYVKENIVLNIFVITRKCCYAIITRISLWCFLSIVTIKKCVSFKVLGKLKFNTVCIILLEFL
jgi:hypothetical protein